FQTNLQALSIERVGLCIVLLFVFKISKSGQRFSYAAFVTQFAYDCQTFLKKRACDYIVAFLCRSVTKVSQGDRNTILVAQPAADSQRFILERTYGLVVSIVESQHGQIA